MGMLQNQKAGIVLTFGTAPNPTEGENLSREINALLQETLPDTFGDSVMRDYHIIEGNSSLRGVVEIEVYVIYESR
jgi:hypothetical protein